MGGFRDKRGEDIEIRMMKQLKRVKDKCKGKKKRKQGRAAKKATRPKVTELN